MTGRRIGAVTGAAVLLLVPACRDPDVAPPEPSPTVTATAIPGAEAPDPRRLELLDEVAALQATLGDARDALAAAQQAGSLEAARAAAEDAVHILTAHPAWAGDLDGDGEVRTLQVEPLLPGPAEAIAEDAFYGDQFARTLTAARAAGDLGSQVVDVLRDPMVGDLGVWQADAGGVLTLVDQAADPADLAAVEAAIAELPGSAARALTYALTAVRSADPGTATTAAERGLAHVQLTLEAVEALDPSA